MQWSQELAEKVLKIVSDLRAESESGAVILVEGKRDEECLKRLGIKGTILKYTSIRALLSWAENNSTAKLIVLTDLDAEGTSIAKRIVVNLSGRMKEVDVSYMRKLSILRKVGIREIKDIASIVPESGPAY
ncbi:MAG: hypothetical protein LZ158_03985 [Thaumarchaeota archaeon]|jgi:5S rRNA maturation endonuclease (ribonuclease M5)|nr:hypothetical protein [Candidatus Terraquivivens yellowstonensis]MCL7395108.1 hypothetical protein [Candidatus Terraquivivens yellowstonensis]MCL7397948.1 hypothetical protein [Candidatus Terraquivivens yellowstonensis]MCL7399336.1 hypothetical protein [Candidatus Terraquivivens yellowstonensis]MCL7400108.1 hypothetical protein [Candidatus Terraquivivens yellowstonensis]